MHCSFIVQADSYRHIKNIVHDIHRTLRETLDKTTELRVCDEIDDVDDTQSHIVFVIGENFAQHVRRPDCTYIYLNFSIVAVLGNPLKSSRVGWSAIRRKQRMLNEKLSQFDAILDYFPPQTAMLAKRLHVPVFGFPIAIAAHDRAAMIPLEDRLYDICFVGNMTPRRREIVDDLTARGLRLSPCNGVVFEEMAAQSRCCLNIHAYRSNHLETPRIVGALAAGTPVVSERSYGMETLVPKDLCISAPLSRLADTTEKILRDRAGLQDLQTRSTTWFDNVYLPQYHAQWRVLCAELMRLRDNKIAVRAQVEIASQALET